MSRAVVQVRQCHDPDWFSQVGVWKKRQQIEAKGVPDMKGWKFITLTVDPSAVESPRDAFENGSKQLRRFLYSLRKYIGRKFRWCWKLEFHESGYPHWHLIVDYKPKFPPDILKEAIPEWWKLGRVNVKAVKRKRFEYLFKYVSKVAYADCDAETGVALPDWVLDYQRQGKGGKKVCGIRFWQTGGGFYDKAKQAERKRDREQKTSRVPYTLRQQIKMSWRKVLVFRKDAEGQIVRAKRVYLFTPWNEFLTAMSMRHVLQRQAALVENSVKCRLQLINEWILKPIQRMLASTFLSNRMTGLPSAVS